MTEKRETRRKLPRWKKLLFSLVTSVLVLAVIESISLFVIRGMLKTNRDQLQDDRRMITMTGIGRKQSGTVVHPYLGWVHNPHAHGVEFDGRTMPINEFGFADDKPAIQKRGPDRVVIGIVGGSVAWQFSVSGEQALCDALRRSPRFRGKKIVVVRMAISAHKQPQQLFVLNYLLSLGAELDYLINIDGFNEVVLVYSNNIPAGVFYAYPHNWKARSVDLMDPQKSAIAWQLLEARGNRQQLAKRFSGSWYQFSPTLNLIWNLRDKSLFASLMKMQTAMRYTRTALGHGYLQTGPKANPKTETRLFHEMVRLWKRCSIQLDGICHANGIRYLHFLQPNQYVKDSKPMDQREYKIATVGDMFATEYAAAVKKGYPLLIREGADLRNRGVEYHDLTMLFAKTKAAIYVDSCCHFNKQGYEMLAQAIADAILVSQPKRR